MNARITRGATLLMAIAIAIAAVVTAILSSCSGIGALGQTADTFKEAFAESDVVAKGVASNALVNESPYAVIAFKCNDIKKVADAEVTANIEATIENDSFATDVKAVARYIDSSKLSSGEKVHGTSSGGYSFEVMESTTTPKKGIDYDQSHRLVNCESALADDKLSCTVREETEESHWFADAVFTSDYKYVFDKNKQAWVFDEVEDSTTCKYKALNGTYKSRMGTDVTLTVTSFDENTGSFSADYNVVDTTMYGTTDMGFDANGTLEGFVELKRGASFDNPYKPKGSYELTAKGTSNSGNGQASVKAELQDSDSGDPMISVSSMRIDVQYHNSSFASTASLSGKMFKEAAEKAEAA